MDPGRVSSHIKCPRLTEALSSFIALMGVLCLQAAAGQNARLHSFPISGVVKDQTGASVVGAEVVVRSGEFAATQKTDDEGRFDFGWVPAAAGNIVVQAKGFAAWERQWDAQKEDTAHLEIGLALAPASERIVVTATRTEMRASDTAASVVLLSPENLATTAALTLDDALRQVPGFSLFRRSGSRTANPTSQGVSLRGLGASGASRALLLADGIPLNDPFGGWIYWDRIPRESISGVEVMRGGASELYGTDALGGVINLIPRRVDASALSLEASYGNERTPDASLSASARAGRWDAQLAAEAFHTDGYFLVDQSVRGRVDAPAGSEHSALNLRLTRVISDRARVFAAGSILGESRQNGKRLEGNRTHIRQLVLGGDWQSQTGGSLSLRAYGGPQVFDQSFFAVAPDRNSETLTREQRVPAQQVGVSGQWSRPAGSRQTLVAGLEGREVRGASDELVYVAGQLNRAVGAGGRERTAGLFGEDIIRVTPRWVVTAGARFDHWRNYQALSTTRPLAKPGPIQVTDFRDRTEQSFSPRLSLLRRLTENISLTASAYRAFRTPTLNELYRSFRVGEIVTLANQELRAERLTGGEAGANFAAFDKRLTARATFFWSEITRPIANLTLRVQPGLITRERENLGRTRSRGLEFDAAMRITSALTVSGAYQFVDATVVSFPANTSLQGLLIPLVPRHQITSQLSFSKASLLSLGLQARIVGAEYDDDRNRLRLGRYFTMDAIVSRRLAHGVELFAAAENLLDQRYTVGRAPVETLGPPLLARVGVKLELSAHR